MHIWQFFAEWWVTLLSAAGGVVFVVVALHKTHKDLVASKERETEDR
jgi:hypothetical protein